MTNPHPSTSIRNPDPILARLWDVKRQINEEAGYLLEKTHPDGERIRRKYSESMEADSSDFWR